MSLRNLRLALWAAVVAAALGALWLLVIAPRFEETVQDTIGRGGYALPATDGGVFDAAALENGPSAVFFGFTNCPDVCPTTLGDIATWRDALGPEADRIRFWFVTVDPERDSLDTLREYISWSEGVTGAAGTPEQVAEALSAFRIYARKVPLEGGGYTMDHSAYVMLFDKDGRFDQVISYQEDPDRAVPKLRRLIAAG